MALLRNTLYFFLHVIKTYTPSVHAFSGNRTHDLGISSTMFELQEMLNLQKLAFRYIYPHVFYYICYVKLYSKSLWNASFLPNSGSIFHASHKSGKSHVDLLQQECRIFQSVIRGLLSSPVIFISLRVTTLKLCV